MDLLPHTKGRSMPATRALLTHKRSEIRCRLRCRLRANAEVPSGGNTFSLAPSQPKTPYGQMMAYYLEMEPTLFTSAVEDQFEKLRDEREARQAEADRSDSDSSAKSPTTELSLSMRIKEVEAKQREATVEDLMYLCILEEFIKVGVGMLPRMDNYLALESVSLTPLMEGVHTKEAIELVREHMMGLLGQSSMIPPTATVKMAKLQVVQVYAASALFGYFVRRVDQRFQLAKTLDMLPEEKEDSVSRLERLFSMTSSEADDMDKAPAESDVSSTASASSPASEDSSNAAQPKKPALRSYIETFDQATMRENATVMSREAQRLLDRQVKALWGDPMELQSEMKRVIGVDVATVEEMMARAEKAVQTDAVATVSMTLATQRRAVLEAVAFGTFLRDVENMVDLKYGLLNPVQVGNGPGGPGDGTPLLPS